MIQRIQSVYLLIVTLFAGLSIWKDELSGVPDTNIYLEINDWSAVGVAFLSLITIFLYNKRKLQIRISYIILFLAMISIAALLVYFFEVALNANWTPFVGFHLLIIIGITLAIRGIKKDEKLIRSLDRLR